MTDHERMVLDHYQLPTAFPVEWPAEKDLSEPSDDEILPKSKRNGLLRRSKSRYSALERQASDRKSLVPGSQKTGDGIENLVQKDEPDPLGATDSVVRALRQKGLPVQEDIELRNRFLLSSTTFSPTLFLSQVHSNDSTESLLHGLEVLTRSIDQKSASLKVLVESNFERFVRAKATIDNVYMEMKNRGAESPSRARPHSRHVSRGSFRGSAGNASMLFGSSPTENKRKNALIKESEYGVLGIKAPLLDVSAKTEEVWGPAIGGREIEESLKVVATTVEQYREYYEASGAIAESVKRKDYENLVEEYSKAKGFAEDARNLGEQLAATKTPPSDKQAQQIIIAARMWHDVNQQVEAFKRDIWRRLIAVQYGAPKSLADRQQAQHMEYISILLELGVEDNPIWVWLLSRYDHLKNKIQATSDRSKMEIEILRRRLANGPKPPPEIVANHLQSLSRLGFSDKTTTLDTPDVIELWERMHIFLTSMLASQGILGEVIEFWQTAEGFINGQTQKALPVGVDGSSRAHHRLSDQGTLSLQKGTVELIDMIRESIFSFFADPPPEDISALFSPVPPTPATPNMTPTTLKDPRFNFDKDNLPPPSPRLNEPWEKLAFWPPWSNSLSGVHYLSKLLALIGTGASEMAGVSLVGKGDGSALDRLRNLVGGARERSVVAICAAWNRDAEIFKALEDWKRSPEKKDLTRMPSNFNAFESAVLSGMQKILYISEAATTPGPDDVVVPPPAKLLQMVRSQFVSTLYKALSGMVENAEKSVKRKGDDWSVDIASVASPADMSTVAGVESGVVDASDRNVRMLLTLSNLHALRNEIVANLTSQFENAFSVKLTDETKTIRNVLGQIDARLFQSYTKPAVEKLRTIIREGILSPEWVPSDKPKEVRPYIYEALLHFVLIHSQVSTTAATLTSPVSSYLLEQATRELLETFKQIPRYTLPALMQATLDVEFIAQTLTQYTTDRATQMQGEIYQILDARTDNEARAMLQSELTEMRNVLKRLREGSRSEFACFKKMRRREEKAEREK